MADDEPIFHDYSRRQLTEAFALVKDRANWKMGIDAVVPPDTDLALVDAAVIFFTGGPIESVRTPDGFRVTSEGYYFHIGS
jgi:hypothetical protein